MIKEFLIVSNLPAEVVEAEIKKACEKSWDGILQQLNGQKPIRGRHSRKHKKGMKSIVKSLHSKEND